MDTSMIVSQDGYSDYGSDFTLDQEEILSELQNPLPKSARGLYPLLVGTKDDEDLPPSYKCVQNTRSGSKHSGHRRKKAKSRVSIEIEGHSNSSTTVENRENETRGEKVDDVSVEGSREPDSNLNAADLRSPLERFRTKPKKPLSVTDLVSPSWCELQYWYTLTKHGRKRRTPAMRQGSAVHKTLEDQVHKTVAVDIQTKEDAWGLRIWNIMQGLKTLRETGMTRELEVWGILDGQVVNGIIDELSYICPDRELEEASGPKQVAPNTLTPDQTTLTDFFKQQSGNAKDSHGVVKNLSSLLKKTSRIYITDVKTRGVKSIPNGASFRPTLMQLFIYHRLLSDLATNRTDPAIFFDRYSLDPDRPFSDALVAQIAAISTDASYDTPSESPSPTTSSIPSTIDPSLPPSSDPQDTLDLLLTHNSLRRIWTLMTREFALTMPDGAASIGDVLKVEYRTQTDGSILGIKNFLYDDDIIRDYLEDGMSWWKGEREARGVCIEEAYKCGWCEFADECHWRKEKVEQATMAHRNRTRSTV